MEKGSQYSHKQEHPEIAPHPESAALRALLLPGMCSGSGIPGSSDIPAEGTEAAAAQQSTCQVPRTTLQVGKNLSLNVQMCWMQLQLHGHTSLISQGQELLRRPRLSKSSSSSQRGKMLLNRLGNGSLGNKTSRDLGPLPETPPSVKQIKQ